VQVIMVIFSWIAKKNKKSDLASSPTITNILTRAPNLALIFY